MLEISDMSRLNIVKTIDVEFGADTTDCKTLTKYTLEETARRELQTEKLQTERE